MRQVRIADRHLVVVSARKVTSECLAQSAGHVSFVHTVIELWFRSGGETSAACCSYRTFLPAASSVGHTALRCQSVAEMQGECTPQQSLGCATSMSITVADTPNNAAADCGLRAWSLNQ